MASLSVLSTNNTRGRAMELEKRTDSEVRRRDETIVEQRSVWTKLSDKQSENKD